MYFQDLNQFLVIALAHLLAVISPGPDFALITRQSFLYGRTSSIYTSLGIASGILVHVSYCIVGLNFLLTNVYAYKTIVYDDLNVMVGTKDGFHIYEIER